MISSRPLLICLASVALLALPLSGIVRAQIGPSPGQGQRAPSPKPDGVAEEAPDEEGALPTTPVLPPPRSETKEFELIELDGYFRMRGDWFKQLNLGFNNDPDVGGAPFPSLLACRGENVEDRPCGDSVTTANMRLRLEPVINLHERASIHTQIDILDNHVLGSTPETFFGDGTPPPNERPLDAFSDTQVPPQFARNARRDSIRVKRAWAEVITPLGLIKAGRQPEHWGLGIRHNAGGYDPIHGTYDFDSDFGDTVDRLMFSSMVPGTQLRGAVAMDWIGTEPTSGQTEPLFDRYQWQPWDLEDEDDVSQWVFILSRLDSPEEFRETVDEGGLALNYGVHFTYRSQDWAQTNVTLGESPAASDFVPRDATFYIPDVWGRIGFGDMELEVEGVAVIGSVGNLGDADIDGNVVTDSVDVRQYGAVGRFKYKFMDGDLELRTEVGYASGDQWDNQPPGRINVRNQRPFPVDGNNDTTIRDFLFDFDYNVDLILFRELIGTVTNATYVKPSIWYEFDDRFTLEGSAIASFANKPVATPGNSTAYGVEFNADAGYHQDGFFAGLSYGLLFPFGALDHPPDSIGQGGSGFGFGENAGEAEIAQTIQARMILSF